MKKLLIVLLLLCSAVMSVLVMKPRHDDHYAVEHSFKLSSERGSCSGVQVMAPSGMSYILSAGHCDILTSATNTITVENEDGVKIERRVIAEDEESDLLLLEGFPNIEGMGIADEETRNEKVMTFTHGEGLDTYKTEGFLIQYQDVMIPNEVDVDKCTKKKEKVVEDQNEGIFSRDSKICVLSLVEVVSNAKIVPGSSGGMVVNSAYELVGIASASNPDFSLFVRLSDIKKFLKGY